MGQVVAFSLDQEAGLQTIFRVHGFRWQSREQRHLPEDLLEHSNFKIHNSMLVWPGRMRLPFSSQIDD